MDTAARLDDRAAPFDSLLVDAVRGPIRRLLPDASTARWIRGLLAQPGQTTAQLGGFAVDAARVATGRSDIAPPRGDRRFVDAAWTESPLLRRLMQLYLAGSSTADALAGSVNLTPQDAKRVRFLIDNLVAAAAPSNAPLLNPAASKAAFDSAGMSLVRGTKQLVTDLMSPPRIPQMVDTSGFEVGRNIAATPGSVVFRNEVCELIQYAPQCDEVFEIPLLIVPPTINKFYVIDLAPGRSMVEFGVRHGRQTFALSWRNPDSAHAKWNLETYVSSIHEALDAVEEITGSKKTALAGICSGGILAATFAAYLAGIGQQKRLAAFILAVTVIDNHDAGTVSAFMDPRVAARAKARSARKGYLDGRALAEVFAWLRPNDLIWNYWVNNYLLGKPPPAFDILFWNADTVRMTAALHADFVDLSVENSLTEPGGLEILGVPIDLGKVTVDSYIVAGIADHITPWTNCYRTTQLLGGKIRFVLSNSGHIAALVNPPGNAKSGFQTGDRYVPDAGDWLASAEAHEGSWWVDIAEWMSTRLGAMKPAPESLGSQAHPPLADAPGTYVFRT
ncbi:MAG: PHA/PHB synthase family protein [Aeromicrobium sp.]